MSCEGFYPLGFTAVIVHGLIFKGILFFYPMTEKLELAVKLIIKIVLQILKEYVGIVKCVLCKKCRIETSIVKWVFFLICMLAGVLHGNILFWAVTSCTFYLSKLLFIDAPQCYFVDITASLLQALNSFSCFFLAVLSEAPTLVFLQNLCTK